MNLVKILPLVFLLFIMACKPNAGTQVQKDIKEVEATEKTTAVENSTKEEGILEARSTNATYRGVLPCDDCEGIKTKYVVMSDYTVTKVEIRMGDSKNVRQSSGEWEALSNNRVRISYKNPDMNTQYFKLLPTGGIRLLKSYSEEYPSSEWKKYELKKQ